MHSNNRSLIESEHIVLFVAQLWVIGGVDGGCGACGGCAGRDHLGGVLMCTASSFDGEGLDAIIAPNVICWRDHGVRLSVCRREVRHLQGWDLG